MLIIDWGISSRFFVLFYVLFYVISGEGSDLAQLTHVFILLSRNLPRSTVDPLRVRVIAFLPTFHNW